MKKYLKQTLIITAIIFLFFPYLLISSCPKEQIVQTPICIKEEWTITSVALYYFIVDVFFQKIMNFISPIFWRQIIFSLVGSWILAMLVLYIYQKFILKNKS